MGLVVDFQHHFMPERILRKHLGSGQTTACEYKEGIPTYTYHGLLANLDQHLADMDLAGIDVAVLTCAAGWETSLEECRRVNDEVAQIQKDSGGRFVGLAHIAPLEPGALEELERAVRQLGLRGVAITPRLQPSTANNPALQLDARELDPFYERLVALDVPLFIHPSLLPIGYDAMREYDLARMLGREFELACTVVRLIMGGVLERFPALKVVVSHLGGGLPILLGRVRAFTDPRTWGRGDRPLPRPFDEYLDRLYFDTAGFAGQSRAVQAALLELKPQQLLLGTDYPQELRSGEAVKSFVDAIRRLDLPERAREGLLGGTAARLLKLDGK